MKLLNLLLLIFIFSCTPKRVNQSIDDPFKGGKLFFENVNLENNLVAKMGEDEIFLKDLQGGVEYNGLLKEREEIKLALLYRQHVSYTKKNLKDIKFNLKKPDRSIESILNQYKIPFRKEFKINFINLSKEPLAVIDQIKIKDKDLKKDNYLWRLSQTHFYHYYLKSIETRMRNISLIKEANSQNMNVQDYVEKYVTKEVSTEISKKQIEEYLNQQNQTFNKKQIKLSKNILRKKREEKSLNYILEKYVMDLPIKINLKAPEEIFSLEEKLTPQSGSQDAKLKIMMFMDTSSIASKEVLQNIEKIIEKYKDLKLTYRPYFQKENDLLYLAAASQFCVWEIKKDQFWTFLSRTTGDLKEDQEKVIFATAKDLQIDVNLLKKCLVEKNMNEIIDYHLKYADYLGIASSPVIFIGGEVLVGNILLEDIEKIIQRKLKVKNAGVW